ncbi:transcriptional regulator [Lysinibacillus fusiformis]|nr:transcriptional regulator [Lysinibacillus fusiformis]
MKEQLIKAMQRGQLVNMMYMSKTGEITKRRVKIITIVRDTFQAYCFSKNAKRTFSIDMFSLLFQLSVRKKRFYD